MEKRSSAEQHRSSHFEQQLADKQSFRHAERTVTFVDIKPEIDRGKPPILFAAGWGETERTFKESLRVIHDDGREVVFFNNPKGRGFVKNKKLDYPEVELEKTESLLTLLDTTDIEKTDIIAHSQGAIYSLLAALIEVNMAQEQDREPRINNILLVAPGGLNNNDNWLKIIARFAGPNALGSLIKKKPRRTSEPLKGALVYSLKNPIRAPLVEPWAIAQTDTTSLIQTLRDKGVKIAIMPSNNDPVFPLKGMLDIRHQEEKPPKIGRLGLFDGVYPIVGDHNDIYTRGRVVEYGLSILDGLDHQRTAERL